MTDIVNRVREGDKEAYTELVTRYQNVIYGLAYHHLQNFEGARDVAQEAFVQAYLQLRQLREPAKFAGWLRQITVNQCQMWKRRQRPTEPLDAVNVQTTVNVLTHEVGQAEERLVVQGALACLSPASQLTLTLFYMHSYSLQEIAAFLEVPVTTVKSRLRNARARLRKELMEMVEETLGKEPLPQDFASRVMRLADEAWVHSLAFSPDGKTLAVGVKDETRLCDETTGAEKKTFQVSNNSAAFSPDGKLLATSAYGEARLHDVQSSELLHMLPGYGMVKQVTFSLDGQMLASVSDVRAESGEVTGGVVMLWNPQTGALQRELRVQDGKIISAAFSPDGQILVSSGYVKDETGCVKHGEVRGWDCVVGELLWTLTVPDYLVASVVFSPDGQMLAGGCVQMEGTGPTAKIIAGQVKLWDARMHKLLRTLPEDELWGVNRVVFAPDGKTLAVERVQMENGRTTHSEVKLWDVPTGQLLRTLPESRQWMSYVAFSPDGEVLVTGGDDRSVKFWRVN